MVCLHFLLKIHPSVRSPRSPASVRAGREAGGGRRSPRRTRGTGGGHYAAAERRYRCKNEAVIAAEQLDDDRKETLWEALTLTRSGNRRVPEPTIRRQATLPWVHPMVAFAAYTGARRSEMLRALATDVDLAGGMMTVREKKRVKGRRSNRTAPITPKLAEVLRDWLTIRPECPFLFCQSQRVTRSKTKRTGPTAITEDEAHDHFKRTVADSKWQVLRGYHVLRHSFISALASEGVDQRVNDEVVGHQSEEQRNRYRHLYPGVMQEAVTRVFG